MSLLPKLPKLSAGMPAPTKVGTQATAAKTPKAKKMPDAFGKKSLFFKSEDEAGIKRESIKKLLAFLEMHRAKNSDKSTP